LAHVGIPGCIFLKTTRGENTKKKTLIGETCENDGFNDPRRNKIQIETSLSRLRKALAASRIRSRRFSEA
jgi:hypothetical protein